MRRLAVPFVVLGLGGCGSQAPAPAPKGPARSQAPAIRAHELGTPVVVTGAGSTRWKLTALRLVRSRGRTVGVRLRLENAGRNEITGPIGRGASLLTESGGLAANFHRVRGACASNFAARASDLVPGVALEGCIPFDLRRGERPTEFRYSPPMVSGWGAWRIP